MMQEDKKIYRIVQVGLGNRGETAVKCYKELSNRVEIVGICDKNPKRLIEISEKYKIEKTSCFLDVEEMLKSCRPELFSFCTLPDVRLELIELAAKYGVKGILFEKPMATSLEEAKKIVDVCKKNGIKAVVCHQHKYLTSFLQLKNAIASGSLGEISLIHAACHPWFSQLGTHYIDYVIWANGGNLPISVAGHIHGRQMLGDSHPSPDYMLGEMILSNGVHAIVQFGYMSEQHNCYHEDYEKLNFPVEFWEDDRLTVYGTTGYAWAECNGRWAVFSKDTDEKIETGCGNAFHDELENPKAQMLFTEEFLDWMEGKILKCSCDVDIAYAGFETGIAIIHSALGNKRVDLPIEDGMLKNELEWMHQSLPECPRRKFIER